MCLTEVISTDHITYSTPQIGYKVFINRGGHKYSCPLYDTDQLITAGSLAVDEYECMLVGDDKQQYRSGFHVFKNREEAELFKQWCGYVEILNLVVRKVKYTERLAIGLQDTMITVVTKNLIILEE